MSSSSPESTGPTGLFGGAFDPPHRGHVELVRQAKAKLGLERVRVLVAADPGHKRVETPAAVRLELARAAFPGDEVVLDVHPRTVETLRAHPEWGETIFLIGADQFLDFPTWREPEEVLRLTRLGVATRPGYPQERLDAALAALPAPDRVVFFEIEPTPVSSRDLRSRLGAGADVTPEVPSAVAAIIAREGLYGADPGYTRVV
jgi:nicotinate-nucleotide adenylyltransferase